LTDFRGRVDGETIEPEIIVAADFVTRAVEEVIDAAGSAG
jgi:hypothetical protein